MYLQVQIRKCYREVSLTSSEHALWNARRGRLFNVKHGVMFMVRVMVMVMMMVVLIGMPISLSMVIVVVTAMEGVVVTEW